MSAKQPVSELIFWSVPGGINRPGPKKTMCKCCCKDLGDAGVQDGAGDCGGAHQSCYGGSCSVEELN